MSSQDMHSIDSMPMMKPVLGSKNYTQKLGRTRRTHIIDETSHRVREENSADLGGLQMIAASTRAGRSPIDNNTGTINANLQAVTNVQTA